ncbi:hypothetical protein RDI58_003942 [Solanum bulbocastanum]|uniref:Uncharacterized protein n=1 Tax=Solanum bulbocastanum TaxID=147425 RepID=A0AAN8YL91_SOLBU
MINRLESTRAIIDHDSITVLEETFLFGNYLFCVKKLTKKLAALFFSLINSFQDIRGNSVQISLVLISTLNLMLPTCTIMEHIVDQSFDV